MSTNWLLVDKPIMLEKKYGMKINRCTYKRVFDCTYNFVAYQPEQEKNIIREKSIQQVILYQYLQLF